MKLYYSPTLNPRKACAVARHTGAPVEFIHVDLGKGEHRRPEFLAKNPNGKVPVLEDGAKTLWESNAIMCHLAIRTGSPLWPKDERQVEILKWLSWDAEHFTRHGGEIYFQYLIKPAFGMGEPDAERVGQALAEFRRFAAVLDDHLDGRRYLVGDELTIADFAVASAFPTAEETHLPIGEFANMARWNDRLNALPAWREPFTPAASAA